MENSSDSLIEEKYGYVEKVKEDWQYKNMDYRDTMAPLWQELNKIHTDPEYFPSRGEKIDYNQRQINLALCASIIQLGKSMQYSIDLIYNKFDKLDQRLKKLERL